MGKGSGEGAERPREARPDADAVAVADLRDRVEVLSELSGGIVFELDREGRYLRVWAGEERLQMGTAEDLIGRTMTEVIGGPLAARFHEAVRGVYDTGQATGFDYALDVPAGRRSFSCEIRARDPRSGAPRTVTLLAREVTAANLFDGKLVQAERLAALGLLAASVGHEIRQPLAYVLTSLKVLERELAGHAPSEPARSSLDNIRGGAERIAEIAASLDLLAEARPRTPKALDVRRPVQAALDLCASELLRIGSVERRLPELPFVSGDEGELCQVFANLLLNAAHAYAPGTTRSPALTLTGAVIGNRVRISVSDTGSGIPPEALPHIFEPFFTTKEAGCGTGLGLFITRSIVEAHGGTIDVTSEVGRGTTVDVLLRIATPSQLPKERITGVRTLARRRRLNILVVDDEPRFLASLRLALEETHDVETESKAASALALVEADPTRYDVVLCDLSMPHVDGVTFYERMESLGLADRFVLMTGGAFTPRTSEFLQRNACPNIAKPFVVESLLGMLDDMSPHPR